MNKQLETLERNIADAKAAASRAQGTLDALISQAERDFGIKSIEEAKALEAELADQVRSLGQRADDEFAGLQAAYSEAVGA